MVTKWQLSIHGNVGTSFRCPDVLPRAFSYLGPFGVLWVHKAWYQTTYLFLSKRNSLFLEASSTCWVPLNPTPPAVTTSPCGNETTPEGLNWWTATKKMLTYGRVSEPFQPWVLHCLQWRNDWRAKKTRNDIFQQTFYNFSEIQPFPWFSLCTPEKNLNGNFKIIFLGCIQHPEWITHSSLDQFKKKNQGRSLSRGLPRLHRTNQQSWIGQQYHAIHLRHSSPVNIYRNQEGPLAQITS